MRPTNRGGSPKRRSALLFCALAFLVLPAVVHPRHTARGAVLPPLVSDACADGQNQYALEGYYILWDADTCQYVWHVDVCVMTSNAHLWCAPNLAIKHYNVEYGDPGDPGFCGPPSVPDTAQGYTYHKRTLNQ